MSLICVTLSCLVNLNTENMKSSFTKNGYFMVLGLLMFLVFNACNMNSEKNLIGKQNPVIENKLMSPEVLWAFGRIGGVEVSPDYSKVLYTVSYYSVKEDKSNTDIFVMNVDGSDKVQLTHSSFREASPRWMEQGTKIAYLSNESGSMQIWSMNLKGKSKKQISDREGGVNEFSISPDGTKILFIADVKYGERTVDKHPDLPNATGIVVEDLMYKHWDEWVSSIPHPFVADFDGKSLTNEIDILEGEPYESPMKPFGGIEQLAWSPDSKTVAYTSRKKTGKEYALSTNSDIYLYTIDSKATQNISEGMMGYDNHPVFSPDGRWLAWESMERDGYESDKSRLFLLNLQTNEKVYVTKDFDQFAEGLTWSDDSKTIYFNSVQHGLVQVYTVDVESNTITQLTKGQHDYESLHWAGNKLIAVKHSMSKPNEIYSVDLMTGVDTEISFENDHILSQLDLGEVKERWTQTTDNKQMHSWVIYPPNFDPSKKYPTLLFCEGGPQQPVSQFWSYRWNFQMMAAKGYIIIAPNRRGLPGFGQEWLEQISGDYGGQNMKDYLSAIDDIATEPYVDADHLGAVGASYGGFSVFWLAGHHEKRFKAFIAHDGMFNLPQQYLETEEMWFVNWDLGGAYWEKDNEVAQRSYANSPHLFVDQWDTPILVVHGEKDYRILASQGMSAFNAAVLRGVPAKLLIYPDENHWVLKPQNGILWQRTFFDWLDKWLK